MRILLTILISMLFLTGFFNTAFAQEPNEGVIEGQVINGTSDSDNVSGIEINLTSYIAMDNLGSETFTTDDQGNFAIEGLSTIEDNAYLISAI